LNDHYFGEGFIQPRRRVRGQSHYHTADFA
jgi:hypothetical protein